jgi:hypothetical protein
MSIFSNKLGPALVLAALCLGGRAADAQAGPMSYWIPGWPIGFGGNPTLGQGSNTYGNFPSFDGSDARGGGTRYNFSNGWFVGSEGGGMGLGMNGISQDGAFGNSLYYQGVQFGYKFQTASGLPLRVFAGFDTVRYNAGIGNFIAPFDSVSGTLPTYSVHGGVEFQPTANTTLSLGFGYTQQSGRLDTDNSLALPAASALAVSGFR